MTDLECCFCGCDLVLEGCVDVFIEPSTGARSLEVRPCCDDAVWSVQANDHAGWLGATYEQLVENLVGGNVQRVEAGQVVTRGRESEFADADGLIVERLTVEIVTGGAAQRVVFDAIERHHRHHPRPRGWHFGIVARRGWVMVGVAACGRPVSRHLQARGVVEVTRVCTWGDSRLRRDVASAIYRAAVKEYRRRRVVRMAGRELRVTEVVTYTLGTESGASCAGAGFVNEGAAGGGSWDRAGRRRANAAPTDVKTRWSLALGRAA